MYKWLKQIHKKNLKITFSDLTNYFKQLVALLKNSSQLQTYLLVTAKLILIHKKKLTNWDLFFMQQIFLTAALNLINISARMYSADLSYTERENLIQSFIQKKKEMMILNDNYLMNLNELNLQHLCHNIILFDIIIFDAVTVQTIDCFWCLEQAHIVHIYNIQIQNSFNIQQILNNMSKVVSEVVTELNNTIFKIEINDIEDNIIIEYWAKISNECLINKNNSEAAEILKNAWLEENDVIIIFLELMSEKKVVII